MWLMRKRLGPAWGWTTAGGGSEGKVRVAVWGRRTTCRRRTPPHPGARLPPAASETGADRFGRFRRLLLKADRGRAQEPNTALRPDRGGDRGTRRGGMVGASQA